MAPLSLYRLQPPPGGGFHFGAEGLELEESRALFSSDSLFAAVVATIAEQEGAAAAGTFAAPFDETTAAWQGRPPLQLSSLFPYAGNLPLFPLPRLRINAADVPRKFAKKVKFVSPAILRRLTQREAMDSFIPLTEETGGEVQWQNGRFLQDGAVWLTAEEQKELPAAWQTLAPAALPYEPVWRQASIPRVTLDRGNAGSMIYLSGRVSFNDGCGLWLGVRYRQDGWQERLEDVLRHLGDRGIGGERTDGYGSFTLTAPPAFGPAWLKEAETEAAGYRLLLSRFIPREPEVDALRDGQAAYHLATVGGWLGSPARAPLRRKRITMVAEGSVLPGPLTGRLADVRPDVMSRDHPVYRSGLALTLPVADPGREA